MFTYTCSLQVCFLIASLSIIAAQYESDHKEEENYAPAHYKYEYGVHDPHTGDIKEAKESSDGHTVTGYYKLKDADGTERIVHYTADKHLGFVAHVNKIGIPHYPVQQPKKEEHQYEIPSYASGFTDQYHQPPPAQHKFHIVHDKHHAKSHQAVKIEEKKHH